MKSDRYQELFERSSDANLIIAGERFVDCNTATIKMLGYKNKQEVLNTHPSQLSPEFQPDGQLSYVKANEMMSIAFDKGSHRFEWDHVRANGEIFPVEVLLTSIPEGKEKTLHVVWRDITDQKKAATALKESRDQLGAIFNSARDGILVADVQTKAFLAANRAICEMLGYSVGEIKKLSVNDIHPVKVLPHVVNQFEKQVRMEIDLAIDTPVLRHNGTVFFADISTSHVTINGKQCVIGIFRDVTERKQIEEKTRHKQKLEAIGTLAGGIAHDFNNILAAILGYSELAQAELPQRSEVYDDLAEVIKAGNRAKELVKQILAFSRHSINNFSPLKIQSCAKEVLRLLRSTLPTTIEIKQEIDNNCGSVMADATQIHQVIMNLCTNAFHAMEETGGVVDIKLQEVYSANNEEFVIYNLPPGKYLKLEVSDNGHGIEEKIIHHIFDPYFTTKAQGKGSGLGLAVVYGIVKDHGGTIHVKTKIGYGTTFTVILPVIDSADDTSESEVKNQSQPTLGYTVHNETDSLVALEVFRNNPQAYDLVITDQTMPHLSGAALSKALMKIRPDIPIILCTGYSSTLSEDQAKALGIRAFVMKPISKLELAQTIRKVLDSTEPIF